MRAPVKAACELDAEWKAQHMDMRRIRAWDGQTKELVYKWVKSEEGNDHFHHSGLYMHIASMIMGWDGGVRWRCH